MKFQEIGIYTGQCTEVYIKIIRKVEIILEIIYKVITNFPV